MKPEQLIENYKEKHATDESYGTGGMVEHAYELELLLPKGSTILDYGCGKGNMVNYLNRRDFSCTGYDPAIPKFAEFPEQEFDAIICLDVLEHLMEDQVEDIFNGMKGMKPKYIVFHICHAEAIHKFPDGRNCHETVRPMVWWHEKMKKSFSGYSIRQLVQVDARSSRWLVERHDMQRSRLPDQEDPRPDQ